MQQHQVQAAKLLELGDPEGAFLSLWRILKVALRRQATEASISIERFPTPSLINHLYSQGELSIEQFDQLQALQTLRNRFVHGYQIPGLDEAVMQLQALGFSRLRQ